MQLLLDFLPDFGLPGGTGGCWRRVAARTPGSEQSRGRAAAAASVTARPGLRGGTSRGWHHVRAQPQRNPPRSALISCGKHFSGAGWRGPGPGLAPRSCSRPPLPPASPAPLPRGRLGGGSATRGAPRARLRAPSPTAPGTALSAATKPPSAPLCSPHPCASLRSAAAVPRQPGWWRRGKDPGAASRLPPPATPRRCRQRSGSRRPALRPCPATGQRPAGAGGGEGEGRRERGTEGARGRGGSARPCCVTMRGAQPRDRRHGAGAARDPALRRLRRRERPARPAAAELPPELPPRHRPATAARGSCARRERLPAASEDAAPAWPVRSAWHAAALKIMEMQSSSLKMPSSIRLHLFKMKLGGVGVDFFFSLNIL